jgi:hypothetical protein
MLPRRWFPTDDNKQSPKTARFRIEALLRDELHRASEHRKQMAAEFLKVTQDAPYGVPSDGTLLMELAAKAQRQALDEYQIALKRFSDFIINGIVPDDLK